MYIDADHFLGFVTIVGVLVWASFYWGMLVSNKRQVKKLTGALDFKELEKRRKNCLRRLK